MKLITYLLLSIVVVVNGEFMVKTKRTVNTNDIIKRYKELTITQCYGRCESDPRCSVFAMNEGISMGQHAECILLRKLEVQENEEDGVKLFVFEKLNTKEISERRILKDGEFQNGGNGQLITNTQADVKKAIYFVHSGTMIWEEAENVCVEWGGHLTSIHSKEENDFILSLHKWMNTDRPIWTGLNDAEQENSFVWTDGSPNTYNGFVDGVQPNGGDQQNCVGLSPTTWRDDRCTIVLAFICKHVFQ